MGNRLPEENIHLSRKYSQCMFIYLYNFYKGKGIMMDKSKGTLEAEISKALTHWEKNYLGRGSVSAKSDILRDMVIVELKGIVTPAEFTVCQDKEGLLSVKEHRNSLVESGLEYLKEIILTLTGQEVVSFHTDISTSTGERVMVFKLSSDLQSKLS
jgi:uncharacterized protein YbcI